MRTLLQYLDDAKKITGSDYRTAQALGVTRQYISTARSRATVSNKVAFRLAELLGTDPAKIIAAIEAEKETDPAERQRWESWVAALALAILAATAEPVFTGGSEAYASVQFDQAIHYAHSHRSAPGHWSPFGFNGNRDSGSRDTSVRTVLRSAHNPCVVAHPSSDLSGSVRRAG